MDQRAKTKLAILMALTVVFAAAAYWMIRINGGGNQSGVNTPAEGLKTNAVFRVMAASEAIKKTAADLNGKTSPAHTRQLLADLKARLGSMPNVEATAAVRGALESGIDAPTGFDLKPGEKGKLSTTPSLRIFLLEQLREFDPAGARQLAGKILERFTTPDEWAMSLTICAADTNAPGREFVQRKAREMALHEPWQRDPSAGFLEAFDVFVFTHDTAFVPELATLLGQTNNRALAHAAFLTIDRLALSDTAATLEALVARPELLKTREATRAGYFARADMRDAVQRAVLERYLLNASLTATELEQFAGTFPNANFTVSQNLLTRSTTPDGPWIAARDAASLQVVEQWLADPRFAHLKPSLNAIRARLQQFLRASQ